MAEKVGLAFRRALETIPDEPQFTFFDAPPTSTSISSLTLALTETPSASTGGTQTSLTVATATPTSSSQPSAIHSKTTKSGTTSSTKIGAGLGVPFALLVIGIVCLACFYYFKRRGSQKIGHHAVPTHDKDSATGATKQ